MTVNLSPKFFAKPSQGDYAKDMRYCENNGIETEGKSRKEIKASILSSATGMNEDLAEKFYTNKGPLDRLNDLAKMAELGIEPTGNREGNKAAIVNAMSATA